MKQTLTIARAELQSFFYSPVAWLILVIFVLQCAAAWSSTLVELARQSAMNSSLPSLTAWMLTRTTWGVGILATAVRYLYVFYPLLTMGLISRELANGSIRLLDSSPLTAWQIAGGKMVAMAAYSLLLLAVLALFAGASVLMIPDFNWPFALTAILGVALTMVFYSAVGLFASSLTRYPVAAAIASLALLMALGRVGEFGQQWTGVREITTWLSTAGREQAFMNGLLSSRHIFYYAILAAAFFLFTVLKLRLSHSQIGLGGRLARYGGVAAAAVALGWLTSQPALRLYSDTTQTGLNTIMPPSRAAMEQLRGEGRLTVTTYVNLLDKYCAAGLPRAITADRAQFEKWQRFKPDMRFDYVYYYAGEQERAREMARLTKTRLAMFRPVEQVDAPIDLRAENFQFVRVLSLPDGRRSVLRMFDQTPPWPDEEEIAVAMKRLVTPMPRVGFVAGHGERSIADLSPQGYNRFAADPFNRFSLVSQGFDARQVGLDEAPDVDILVIADPQSPYSERELAVLDAYLDRGGNLVLLVEPDTHPVVEPLLSRLGLVLESGRLAQTSAMELADVVGVTPTPQAVELLGIGRMKYQFREVAMPGAGVLRVDSGGVASGSGSGSDSAGALGAVWQVRPLMATRPDAWNKIGAVDWIQGDVQPIAARGEHVGVFTPALVLVRRSVSKGGSIGGVANGFEEGIAGAEQRVVVVADADWLDNNEVRHGRSGFTSRPGNMAYYTFGWLSGGVAPMIMHRPAPTDTTIALSQGVALSQSVAQWLRVVALWLVPALLVLLAATILIRRNRK